MSVRGVYPGTLTKGATMKKKANGVPEGATQIAAELQPCGLGFNHETKAPEVAIFAIPLTALPQEMAVALVLDTGMRMKAGSAEVVGNVGNVVLYNDNPEATEDGPDDSPEPRGNGGYL